MRNGGDNRTLSPPLRFIRHDFSCAMRALGSRARVMPRYSIVRVSLLANGSASAAVRYATSRTLALAVVVRFFVFDDCNIAFVTRNLNGLTKLTTVNFAIRQKKSGPGYYPARFLFVTTCYQRG